MIEGGECRDPADRPSLLDGRQRTDFRTERRIAADNLGLRANRGQVPRQPLFENGAVGIGKREDEGLARVERGPAQ